MSNSDEHKKEDRNYDGFIFSNKKVLGETRKQIDAAYKKKFGAKVNIKKGRNNFLFS